MQIVNFFSELNFVWLVYVYRMQLSTFVVAAETSYLVKGQCIRFFVFFQFVGLSPSTSLCFYG